MSSVLDRDALYYPRIHIRDENWLKATLLSFPQVRRIVPSYYDLKDSPSIRAFRELRGPRGEPLLVEEDPHSYEVYAAQQRLAQKLRGIEPDKLRRFTRRSTEARYRGNRDQFQIHTGKLHDVLGFLEERDMMWRPSVPQRGDWVCVHPNLGTAIMSYIAIGIATAKGLDIVTEAADAHRAVATMNDDLVFDELIVSPFLRRPAQLPASDGVDQLTQTVLSFAFDVTRLFPHQIAELLSDGKDLRSFKQALAPIAATIPQISDPEERTKRFRAAALEVVDAWEAHKKSLPRFALDAIVNATKVRPPDVISGVLMGASSTVALGVGTGLMVGFLAYAGVSIFRDYRTAKNSPYRYLSKIHSAGATLSISR